MTASLQEDLASLTGEEIYHLVSELGRAAAAAQTALDAPRPGKAAAGDLTALWAELTELQLIALAQVARITVPIREAAAIIYRAVYSRHHPVRVPGT
jgi:hypothetical protein